MCLAIIFKDALIYIEDDTFLTGKSNLSYVLCACAVRVCVRKSVWCKCVRVCMYLHVCVVWWVSVRVCMRVFLWSLKVHAWVWRSTAWFDMQSVGPTICRLYDVLIPWSTSPKVNWSNYSSVWIGPLVTIDRRCAVAPVCRYADAPERQSDEFNFTHSRIYILLNIHTYIHTYTYNYLPAKVGNLSLFYYNFVFLSSTFKLKYF